MKQYSPPGKEKENPDEDGAKNKKKRYWKAVRIVAFFGIIEVFSLALWIKSEDFSPESASSMRWLAACGFLAGGAYLFHKFITGKNQKYKKGAVWSIWVLVCVSLPFFKSPQIPEHPSVSLDLGQNLDPKDPFGQSFIITASKPVSNVWAKMYWNNSSAKRVTFEALATNVVSRLSPTFKYGLHFSEVDFASPKNSFPEFDVRTFINVDIHFTPALAAFETNQAFKFCVTKDPEGKYLWTPAGEGESLANILYIHENGPVPLSAVAPFLDVQISAVENLPQENKLFPIEIDYNWKNIGGIPADDVYIEWTVFVTNNIPRMKWNHHNGGIGGILLPGATNNTARLYTESPERDIFDGIMSGRYFLTGTVLFKDEFGHFYAMLIKSIRTNGVFATHFVGLGGYYRDLMATNSPNAH